jgi:hypothetical protein
MGGKNIIVKVQAAVLPVDGANFASRGPGGERGLLQVFGLTGDLYRAQMRQQSGASQLVGTSVSGAVGLDALLTVALPTDSNGRPSGNITNIATAVNLLSDFAAIASGSSSGIIGETFGARPAPRIIWDDVLSDLQGTVSIEHTLSPSPGGFLELPLEVHIRNYLALRLLARSIAAPAANDSLLAMVSQEGM